MCTAIIRLFLFKKQTYLLTARTLGILRNFYRSWLWGLFWFSAGSPDYQGDYEGKE